MNTNTSPHVSSLHNHTMNTFYSLDLIKLMSRWIKNYSLLSIYEMFKKNKRSRIIEN